jgi:transcriptional regulator with XRE-family HTH domain
MSLEPDPASDDPAAAIARFTETTRGILAHHLTALREAAGLTQEQFASRVGFSRSTVANAEGGHRKASADFWHRADDVLGAGGTLSARYDQLQDATRRHAELLDRAAGADLYAATPDVDSSARDSLTVAGLRISAAMLDLLGAVRDSTTGGPTLSLTASTRTALRQVQEDTGDTASAVANRAIQLYSYVRLFLADGAEILIRQPGTEDHTILLK